MAEPMSDSKKKVLEAQQQPPHESNNPDNNSGLVEAVAIEVTDDHHAPPPQARVVVYEYAASSTNPPVRNNSAIQCCYPVSPSQQPAAFVAHVLLCWRHTRSLLVRIYFVYASYISYQQAWHYGTFCLFFQAPYSFKRKQFEALSSFPTGTRGLHSSIVHRARQSTTFTGRAPQLCTTWL